MVDSRITGRSQPQQANRLIPILTATPLTYRYHSRNYSDYPIHKIMRLNPIHYWSIRFTRINT